MVEIKLHFLTSSRLSRLQRHLLSPDHTLQRPWEPKKQTNKLPYLLGEMQQCAKCELLWQEKNSPQTRSTIRWTTASPSRTAPVFLSAPHLCALQKSYRHVNKTRHFILYSKQQCKLSCAIAIHIRKLSLFMGKNKQTNMQKNKPTNLLFLFLHYFIMLLLYLTHT